MFSFKLFRSCLRQDVDSLSLSLSLSQNPSILEYEPVREFLCLDDQRGTLPLYDRETIDEDGGPDGAGSDENRMDLGNTEKQSAQITDFKLLKVIGKGSFGKVSLSVSICPLYISISVNFHLLTPPTGLFRSS